MARHAYRTAIVASAWLFVVIGASCQRRKPTPTVPSASASASSSSSPVHQASARPSPAASLPAITSAPPATRPDARVVRTDAGAGRAGNIDIGPAAAVAMTSIGAVMRSSDDNLVIAKLHANVLESFPPDVKGSQTDLISVVEGAPTRAYWISKGRLVRRQIDRDGTVHPLEVLTQDAANYTRVVVTRAPAADGRDIAVYVGSEVSRQLERGARVWIEGKGTERLGPDGGGATSVTALALDTHRALIAFVDGRTAMSPVHARFISYDVSGKINLGEDRVVFVAAQAQSRTHIEGLSIGSFPFAMLPIARDAQTFGLLSLRIEDVEGEAASSWYMYPNGLEPAPAVADTICGHPTVILARPESADPKSEHVLEAADLSPEGHVVNPRILMSGPKMKALSVAPLPAPPQGWSDKRPSIGAWMVFTSAGRLVARSVLCRPKAGQ